MNELFSIAGKVAIITGAGGVLGGSMAKHFVQQGAKVVAVDIRQEQLDKRVAELEQQGGEVMGVVGNVLEVASLENLAEQVVSRWGKIDILLNIAGGNMPDEETARQMEEVCDALKKSVEKNKLAILTGVYTGGGRRVWVFYTRHNGAFGETLNASLSAFPLLPISIYAEKDPEWDEYSEIEEMQSPEGEEE